MHPFPKTAAINDPHKKIQPITLKSSTSVENGFSLLVQKWCVFYTSIETDVDTEVSIFQACCCLHNYIIIINNNCDGATEVEEQTENEQPCALLPQTSSNHRANNTALEVTNTLWIILLRIERHFELILGHNKLHKQ